MTFNDSINIRRFHHSRYINQGHQGGRRSCFALLDVSRVRATLCSQHLRVRSDGSPKLPSMIIIKDQ